VKNIDSADVLVGNSNQYFVTYIRGVSGGICHISLVNLHQYNLGHLYPKLNGYGDHGAEIVVILQFYVLYMLKMMCYSYVYTVQAHPLASSSAKPDYLH